MAASNQYVAFLRGINVGGKTMVRMNELKSLCEEMGFRDVSTYINSGNVLFHSSLSAERVRNRLESALITRWWPIKTVVLSVPELNKIVAHNPFPDARPAQVGVLLTSHSLQPGLSAEFTTPGREKWVVGTQAVYVHFPDGMGRSKLKWPSALKDGTVRNLNTLSKLAALAETRA